MSQQWEYRIFSSSTITLDELNALGVQGWELIQQAGDGWIFKRPIPLHPVDFTNHDTNANPRPYIGLEPADIAVMASQRKIH